MKVNEGQFGMKYLAQYIWWPHINRQFYCHGISCSEGLETGKNKKNIIPNTQISDLLPFSEPNEELKFDFAVSVEPKWVTKK